MKAIKNDSEKKATMIMENSMGIVVMWHVWLKEVYIDHKNGKTIVIYKEKGKRKIQDWGFPLDNQICFAEEWQLSKTLTNKAKNSFMAPEMVSFDDTFDRIVNEMNDVVFTNK